MLSAEELKLIAERAEAATPGPWTVQEETADNEICVNADPCHNGSGHLTDDNVVFAGGGTSRLQNCWDLPHWRANMAFIAASRQDVPALLAHIAELEAQAPCWIPVTEALPEPHVEGCPFSREVWVCYWDEESTLPMMACGHYIFGSQQWQIDGAPDVVEHIALQWMPKPEPPKPQVLEEA